MNITFTTNTQTVKVPTAFGNPPLEGKIIILLINLEYQKKQVFMLEPTAGGIPQITTTLVDRAFCVM